MTHARAAVVSALALLVSLFAVGCSEEETIMVQDVLQSDAPRAQASAPALAAASPGLSAFATDLYAILAREHGNLAFSPYSAVTALAMTRAGAAGETLRQMSAVLHTDETGALDDGLNAIDLALAKRAGEYEVNGEKVQLELATANQLWAQLEFPFEAPFLDTLATRYGAGMRLLDYVTKTEESRETINKWVSDRTRERIPELIPQGVITPDTRLVLTNAIYLKAPWRFPFEKSLTAAAPFTTLDGTEIQTDLMHLNESLRYAQGDGYQAVELPYADGSLSMLVLVPDAGQFEAVEARLADGVLGDAVEGLAPAAVDLALPKFEFRTKAGLKDPLMELGMPIAFEGGAADFTRMSPRGKDLYIQDVIHEAFISVDEVGTEAAAATAVVVGETSAPVDIVDLTVDRPFVFAIRDNETGALLFLGRVLDPTV